MEGVRMGAVMIFLWHPAKSLTDWGLDAEGDDAGDFGCAAWRHAKQAQFLRHPPCTPAGHVNGQTILTILTPYLQSSEYESVIKNKQVRMRW
jgi:hypothetical protein